MCTFIDSISFCSFLFSIACARAVLTLSLWSKVWSENAYSVLTLTEQHSVFLITSKVWSEMCGRAER